MQPRYLPEVLSGGLICGTTLPDLAVQVLLITCTVQMRRPVTDPTVVACRNGACGNSSTASRRLAPCAHTLVRARLAWRDIPPESQDCIALEGSGFSPGMLSR